MFVCALMCLVVLSFCVYYACYVVGYAHACACVVICAHVCVLLCCCVCCVLCCCVVDGVCYVAMYGIFVCVCYV